MKLKAAKKLIAKWEKEDREHNKKIMKTGDPYEIYRPPSARPTLEYLHKGEKMEQDVELDIWIVHAEKVRAARDEKELKETELRKEKLSKTKCDNCGKFGAEECVFQFNKSDDMHGFKGNLCEECVRKFDLWHQIRNHEYVGPD